ncbi:MAG: hypothetical protein AB8B77_06820, partial [Alphaproteobacteria bacterium]
DAVNIQTLSGQSTLVIDDALNISGDLFDYTGKITLNANASLTVDGSLDLNDKSIFEFNLESSTTNTPVIGTLSAGNMTLDGALMVNIAEGGLNVGTHNLFDGDAGNFDSMTLTNSDGDITPIFYDGDGNQASDYFIARLEKTTDDPLTTDVNEANGVQLVVEALDANKHHIVTDTEATMEYGDTIMIMTDDNQNNIVNISATNVNNIEYIDGGGGTNDTLALTGDDANYTNLFANEIYKLNHFEVVDISGLTGQTDTSFVFTADMIKQLTDDQSVANGTTTYSMSINGDSDSVVDLDLENEFTKNTSDKTGYSLYQSGDTKLYVQDDVTVK